MTLMLSCDAVSQHEPDLRPVLRWDTAYCRAPEGGLKEPCGSHMGQILVG